MIWEIIGIKCGDTLYAKLHMYIEKQQKIHFGYKF